jgi:hypothetical protein
MKKNADIDYIGPSTLTDASLAFLGEANDDPYNKPLTALPEWWQDLPVWQACVLVGEYEVFLDHVSTFVQMVQVSS